MADPLAAVTEVVRLKGALPPLRKPLQIVVARNGLFKRAANDFMEAAALMTEFAVLLPPVLADLQPYARWLPASRLPEAWLQLMLNAAYRPPVKEILFHVYYEPDGGFRLVQPAQIRSVASVRPLSPPPEGVTVTCELHSHHRMPTRFSSIDNADEQSLRFYAVFGWSTGKPTIRLRAGVYGYHVEVPLTTVFEGCGPFEDLYHANQL